MALLYTFDTTTPSTDFSVTGLKNSDTVASVTLSSTGAAAAATFVAPGPTYAITVSGASGTGLGNYIISYTPATLTITQATLTITATNRSKVFAATYTPDTTPPSVDFKVSGLVNSDTVTSITLTCPGYAAAALPQPTPYTVTPSAAVGHGTWQLHHWLCEWAVYDRLRHLHRGQLQSVKFCRQLTPTAAAYSAQGWQHHPGEVHGV